jgi:hypothetical protein
LRYATHENTFLNLIWEQLQNSGLDDAKRLCGFIERITYSKEGQPKQWRGDRDMIDMLELVKRYYYHPSTNGSNSIKQVLPAVLNCSAFLQDRYSKPIYGNEIKSLNFTDWAWVHLDESGPVIDPYRRLGKMIESLSECDHDVLLSEDDELHDGGAAMTAYMLLQYSDMTPAERRWVETPLKKFCELDTLARLTLYEAFREWVK